MPYRVGDPKVTEWSSTTTSPVISAPDGGVTNGRFMEMIVVTSSTCVISGVAGWTLRGQQNGGAACSVGLLYKFANNEGSSWTMTSMFSEIETGRAVVLVYADVDALVPIVAVATASDTSGTTTAGPTIGPPVDGCMIQQFYGSNPAVAISSTPDSAPVATEIIDSHDAGLLAYIFAQEYLQAVAAPIALDSTQTINDNLGVFQIAISPPRQRFRPDADVADGGWTTTPLWSKIEEETADATIITATAA
jgi:hypothetical protein